MDNFHWKKFLTACRETLGVGANNPSISESWCAYTTFSSLEHGVYYFNSGFPEVEDLLEDRVADGSLWRQSISYSDLAHIVIPSVFYWENVIDGVFGCGYKNQDLQELAARLALLGINYRLSERVLEIKLY